MLSDSRKFFKSVVTFSLFASPLLLFASALVAPSLDGNEAEQLAVVGRDPERYYLFTLLSFASSALLVPVLLGLMYMLRQRAATLGNLGGSLALIGTLIAVGDAISQLFIWQMAAPGADQGQMSALLTRFDNAPGAALIFRIGGPSFVLGMVLLGIGLFRAKAVPAWTSAGLAAGAFLNIAGFVIGSNVLVAISSAVLLVSLGWIGRLVLGSSDLEWERLAAQPQTRSSALEREGLRGATRNSR